MRFSTLLARTEAKQLTQDAASSSGFSVRTNQRRAQRYEAEVDDVLICPAHGSGDCRRAPE